MVYRREKVWCGKKGCSKCSDRKNGAGHGPYWYGYQRQGGRVKKTYFGKFDPRQKAKQADAPLPKVDRLDGIFNSRTASMALAHEILGTKVGMKWNECRKAFIASIAREHPDKGGNTLRCQRLTAAWAYLDDVFDAMGQKKR